MTAALTAAKRALMARLATEVGTTAQVSIVRPLKAEQMPPPPPEA